MIEPRRLLGVGALFASGATFRTVRLTVVKARLILTAALLIAAAAACGGDDSDAATDAPTADAGTVAAIPKCSDVFAEGKVPVLDDANPTCVDPDGTTQALGAFRCADGTHLITVDKKTGASSAGWYVTGQPFHAVDQVSADAAYAAAYRTCNQ